MKRNYVKPELEVVIFASESPILSGSVGEMPGGDGPALPSDTKKFQGGWNSNNWE